MIFGWKQHILGFTTFKWKISRFIYIQNIMTNECQLLFLVSKYAYMCGWRISSISYICMYITVKPDVFSISGNMANDLHVKEMEEIVTCRICSNFFSDARTLSCQHCFCLSCLINFQTTPFIKPCPICKEDTVPAVHELHRLPANRAVNDMVAVVVQRRGKKNMYSFKYVYCFFH